MGGRITMDIHIYPAIVALVAAALAGWFHVKETPAIVFTIMAALAVFVTVDPYRIKAIESTSVCVADSGCQSTGLPEYLVAIAVGLVVCVIVGLIMGGLAKLVIAKTTPVVGSHDEVEWPNRPHWASRHRR